MANFLPKYLQIGVMVGIVLILITICVAFAIQTRESPQQKFTIKYENGLISADIDKADVKDVLEEIAKQTGIKASMLSEDNQKISAHFTNLKPREAIKKLLEPLSY